VVPLKISLFVWRLFLNHIPAKDNLHERALNYNDQICTGGCGANENKDHLLVRYDFFSKLWLLVANWLSFETVSHGYLYDHLMHFGDLVLRRFNWVWILFGFHQCVLFRKNKMDDYLKRKIKLYTSWKLSLIKWSFF